MVIYLSSFLHFVRFPEVNARKGECPSFQRLFPVLLETLAGERENTTKEARVSRDRL